MSMRTPFDRETKNPLTAAATAERDYDNEGKLSEKELRDIRDLQPLQGFGWVDPHEEAQAKALIDEQLTKEFGGPFTVKTCGFFIALKIYVRPEELKTGVREDGSTYSLWIAPKATQQDKYQAASALVIGMGPQ